VDRVASDELTPGQKRLRRLLPMAIFVVVVDTTIMNVSIRALVQDLDTEVSGVQSAVALYALVIAAFLLTGAKLGDVIGRRRAFTAGLVLYGIGSLGTALSLNLAMLIVFWSVLEGLGAALLLPTVQALVRTHFEGMARARLYGLIGSVVGAGAAVGPLVGGFFTTVLSWRYAFAIETLVVLFVLWQLQRTPRVDTPRERVEFDPFGSVLSILGLASIVIGILIAARLGPVKAAPVVGCGVLLLVALAWWVRRRDRVGRTPLLSPTLFANRNFLSGVTLTLIQQFVMGGYMLVIPIFTQMVLEYSALQSGLLVLPLSVTMFVTSNALPRVADRIAPKRLVQMGIVLVLGGIATVTATIGPDTAAAQLIPGLVLMGLGLGAVVSQLNNLILSSVDVERASEAGGVNSTASQLGISLGTAVAGTVMLLALTSFFTELSEDSTVLSAPVKEQVADALDEDARFLTNTELRELVADAPEDTADEIVRINTEARPDALRVTLMGPLAASLLGLVVSTRLPGERLGEPRALDAA
jgi:EmrB/QacA subfamily drug resistance transporter